METGTRTFSKVVKVHAIDVALYHNTHYFLGRRWEYKLVKKLLVEHNVFEIIDVYRNAPLILEGERRNRIGTQHEMLLGQLTINKFTLDIAYLDVARAKAFHSGSIYHHSAEFVLRHISVCFKMLTL